MLSLVLRGNRWLDRSAAALYGVGALGALAAFQSGRSAVDGLGLLPAQAEMLVGAHRDWALRTLLVVALLAVTRIVITWRDRQAPAPTLVPLRITVLVVAAAGLWMLYQTADRGGGLVYVHAVGVSTPETTIEGAESTLDTAPAPAPSTSASDRVERRDDGSIVWSPAPSDADALDAVVSVENGAGATLRFVDPQQRLGGMALDVSGRSLLLFPDQFENVRVGANLDVSGFEGRVSIVHHLQSAQAYGAFEITTDGTAELVRVANGARDAVDSKKIDLPTEALELVVTAAGTHFRGYLGDAMVVHGHHSPDPAGRVGIAFDGSGIVVVRRVTATPLEH